eukprot:ctg_466.g241
MWAVGATARGVGASPPTLFRQCAHPVNRAPSATRRPGATTCRVCAASPPASRRKIFAADRSPEADLSAAPATSTWRWRRRPWWRLTGVCVSETVTVEGASNGSW